MIFLLKPLWLVFVHVFKRTFTVKFPFETLKPPERCIGRHRLRMEMCISCGICAWVCPSKAIELVETSLGKRPQINYAKCVFCELCIEYCPRNAIVNTQSYELANFDKDLLTYSPVQLSVAPEVITGRKEKLVRFHKRGGPSHASESV